jgi:hypothetical protein
MSFPHRCVGRGEASSIGTGTVSATVLPLGIYVIASPSLDVILRDLKPQKNLSVDIKRFLIVFVLNEMRFFIRFRMTPFQFPAK